MSRDWTPEELEVVSKEMKAAGHLSYEEFCEQMNNGYFAIISPSADCEDTGKPEQSDNM